MERRRTRSTGAIAVAAAIFVSLEIILGAAGARAQAQSGTECATSVVQDGVGARRYDACVLLPALGASVSWLRELGGDGGGGLVHVAFTGWLPRAGGWVAWGVNSVPSSMVGAEVLVAFAAANGSSTALPFRLTVALLRDQPLVSSPVDLLALEGVRISDLQVTLFASVQLRPGQTSLNQVWNSGPSVTDGVPAPHALDGAHLSSFASLDFSSGAVESGPPVVANLDQKNAHALLCAVGFGLLLPLGALAARYLRAFTLFEPYWVHVHALLQVSGYVVGVAGFALGLVLDSYTAGSPHAKHKDLGIAIFSFVNLQMLTAILRPAKGHKWRRYWNVVHHVLGYAVVFITIANIFEGLDILAPGHGWRRGYVGFLVLVGCVVFILEIITWMLYFMGKNSEHASSGVSKQSGDGVDEGSVRANWFFRRRSDPSLNVSGANAEAETEAEAEKLESRGAMAV